MRLVEVPYWCGSDELGGVEQFVVCYSIVGGGLNGLMEEVVGSLEIGREVSLRANLKLHNHGNFSTATTTTEHR